MTNDEIPKDEGMTNDEMAESGDERRLGAGLPTPPLFGPQVSNVGAIDAPGDLRSNLCEIRRPVHSWEFSTFVLRHSFVIGYFVIRHSSLYKRSESL